MKKSIYFIVLLLLTSFLVVAQPDDPRTGTDGGGFDMMSGLIGLIVGAALGFFGSKMMGKKNA